jgi:hypothetical protein
MDSVFRRFPAALVVFYCLRVMILGPTLVDIGLLAVLGAVFCFCEYKTENKVLKSLLSDVEDLKTKCAELEKGNSDLKTYVSGIKMSINMKTSSMSGSNPMKF